jgi:hypothetical protein
MLEPPTETALNLEELTDVAAMYVYNVECVDATTRVTEESQPPASDPLRSRQM